MGIGSVLSNDSGLACVSRVQDRELLRMCMVQWYAQSIPMGVE